MFASRFLVLLWTLWMPHAGLLAEATPATDLASRFAAEYGSMSLEGRIDALQSSDVSPQINSIVTEVLFEPGAVVAAGDLLFRLDVEDFELELQRAEADLKSASAARLLARQEYDRAVSLLEREAVSEVQVQRALATLNIAQADEDRARTAVTTAKLNIARGEVAAPHTGVIGPALVSPGAFVEAEAGSEMAQIVQLDPIRLTYWVPYAAVLGLIDLRIATDVNEALGYFEAVVELPGLGEYPYRATLRGAAPKVSSDDGTVAIWAELPNPALTLRPGMQVEVTLQVKPGALD